MTGALERMVADGGTAMGDGLARGLAPRTRPCRPRTASGTRKLPAVIVLLSDGKNTLGAADPLEIARQAKEARIPIYAIALGTDGGEVVQQDPFGFTQRIPVPPDKATLREIATITGGRFFEAVSDGRRRADLQPHRHAADLAGPSSARSRSPSPAAASSCSARRRALARWFGRASARPERRVV